MRCGWIVGLCRFDASTFLWALALSFLVTYLPFYPTRLAHLPGWSAKAAAAGVGGSALNVSATALPPEGLDLENHVAQIEKTLLLSALQQSGGVQTKAADLLKISYRWYRHLAKKYDL